MHIYDISAKASLDIIKVIGTAKERVGLDSPFIIAVNGADFVGQFTQHNEREYITLQSVTTKEIYHDLRFEAGNIHTLIKWICDEAYYVKIFGGEPCKPTQAS
jgi:hypothetical protein